MKRTIVATSFVLMAGLIGAAVVFILLDDRPRAVTTQPTVEAAQTPPSHIISQYRVAVRFPDRFEFDSETRTEVSYYDPKTHARIAFIVTRLSDIDRFKDIADRMERFFAFDGVLERVEPISDTHIAFTHVEVFRRVNEVDMFVGEDCWGKPLLVRAVYIYDRTQTPEDAWLTQNDDDFPKFEFAYRCPT